MFLSDEPRGEPGRLDQRAVVLRKSCRVEAARSRAVPPPRAGTRRIPHVASERSRRMRPFTIILASAVAFCGCSSSDKGTTGGAGGAAAEAGPKAEAGVKYTCQNPQDLLS